MSYAPLSHIVEPERLLLTWQPVDEQSVHRTRRTVGEVLRGSNDSEMVFRYLIGTADFTAAQAAGFQGFPAFPVDGAEVTKGVHETFMRRLPPRKREDFVDFLAQHRLPAPFPYSDMALLGYTGARLPSDGFALVPQFPADAMPCDYLMEVAGLRHVYSGSTANIRNGDVVSFQAEPSNPVDSDALAVLHAGRVIGYVTRTMRSSFHAWLGSRKLLAIVERQNGKSERPLIYLRISVT
jgi:hypothetical protein